MILKECTPGQEIAGFLAVRKSSIGRTQQGTGNPYLSVTLSDGQMDIDGKQWGYDGPLPQESTIIKVQAMVETYQERPQLKISRWRPAEAGEFEPTQFIPKTPRDIETLKTSLIDHIESIKNNFLKDLIDKIMGDYYDLFCACPAALVHHQNYIGGLLEHTVGVTDFAMQIAYGQEINEDLLRAGAVLHDIGKIWDYRWDNCCIDMTDHGKLVGHIPQGIMIIDKAANESLHWEEPTLLLLKHMIASHHGKIEWGSPVEPLIKEAIILHRADVLDATMWKINKAESEAQPGEWSPRIYGLGNKSIYVPMDRRVENVTEIFDTSDIESGVISGSEKGGTLF